MIAFMWFYLIMGIIWMAWEYYSTKYMELTDMIEPEWEQNVSTSCWLRIALLWPISMICSLIETSHEVNLLEHQNEEES